MWSAGVIAWELATGRVPWEDKKPAQIMTAILHKKKHLEIPDGCPQPFKELMLDCFQFEAAKRPSFAQLAQRLKKMKT